MKYHYKLVNCKKIIQKWVSIYETSECDIGIPSIHRSFRRLTVVNGTPRIGASQYPSALAIFLFDLAPSFSLILSPTDLEINDSQ